MKKFEGFPSGKVRQFRIPGPFFSDLMPDIDDLGEMKVTLYTLWFLDQMEGNYRYMQRDDFLADQVFMSGLGDTPEAALVALDDAIARAVGRGTLLEATINMGSQPHKLYFLNTQRGRAAVKGIQEGEWRPTGDEHQPVALNLQRPNIYRLYEEHIGPLTPMIADTLRDAEATYPAAWIEDALRIAVENNVRRWRYVEAILRSWREEGRNEQYRGDTEKDRSRYIQGKFADLIDH